MSSISIRALSPRQAHALARRADYFPLLQRAMGSLWMAGCLGGSALVSEELLLFLSKGNSSGNITGLKQNVSIRLRCNSRI